jgi:putative transcriptional regulator
MDIEAGVKNKVKELRKKRGWTQSEFGEKLGISRQSVHSIETERYDPSLPLAFRIADVLGISLDKIFEKPKGS